MFKDVTTGDIINTLKSICKCKSPGIDKITNFTTYSPYIN